jgi:hypothetical protein
MQADAWRVLRLSAIGAEVRRASPYRPAIAHASTAARCLHSGISMNANNQVAIGISNTSADPAQNGQSSARAKCACSTYRR